jgi:ATP/maltotriose-dependent transcriptional regulator MalT
MPAAPAHPIVVATKLRPPRIRAEIVDRPDLLARLREGRERKLTLVCAPAGYGKSTLLAQWVDGDRSHTPFVWLSLETADSDPTRLWTHLISGLHDVHVPCGAGSLAALSAGPRAIADTVIPLLVQELADAPPLVVILDDWHVVKDELCDSTLALLVERAPEAVQIVVSARADPALPIARLRAHGALTEVRAAALRMTTDEAAELVRRTHIDLERADVERLNQRTEGWPAGICLALLAAKEHHDRRRFLEEFSGGSRHVLDFLADDVLAVATPATREFLLRTSVLGRLTAELCDAVLETTTSAAVLADIARENLFVVPLDESGAEYRYHHLFEAMLERELRASDPAAPSELHARAARWFETQGDIEAAVEHAIASGDAARSSDLIVRHATRYWVSGRLLTVSRWLAALSSPEARADPKLAIVRAQIAGLAGNSRDEIERWLVVAESASDPGPLANGLASIRSAVGLVRSAYLTKGIGTAETSSRLALELEPPQSPWRLQMLVTLGQALYLGGYPERARPPLEEARAMPGGSAAAPAAALGLAYLALIALESGSRAEAESIAREALAILDERYLGSGIAAVTPHVALGCALVETPDVHAAADHLARAVELATPTAPSYWHAHALIRQAAALHRLGKMAAAGQSLARAATELDSLPDRAMLGELYESTREAITGRPRREGFLGDDLSEAETRIARSLMAGSSLNEVAQELYLSPNTVKTHRRSVYRKLGVSTRNEFLERAKELQIDTPHDD